jgi:hypothetical protein
VGWGGRGGGGGGWDGGEGWWWCVQAAGRQGSRAAGQLGPAAAGPGAAGPSHAPRRRSRRGAGALQQRRRALERLAHALDCEGVARDVVAGVVGVLQRQQPGPLRVQEAAQVALGEEAAACRGQASGEAGRRVGEAEGARSAGRRRPGGGRGRGSSGKPAAGARGSGRAGGRGRGGSRGAGAHRARRRRPLRWWPAPGRTAAGSPPAGGACGRALWADGLLLPGAAGCCQQPCPGRLEERRQAPPVPAAPQGSGRRGRHRRHSQGARPPAARPGCPPAERRRAGRRRGARRWRPGGARRASAGGGGRAVR